MCVNSCLIWWWIFATTLLIRPYHNVSRRHRIDWCTDTWTDKWLSVQWLSMLIFLTTNSVCLLYNNLIYRTYFVLTGKTIPLEVIWGCVLWRNLCCGIEFKFVLRVYSSSRVLWTQSLTLKSIFVKHGFISPKNVLWNFKHWTFWKPHSTTENFDGTFTSVCFSAKAPTQTDFARQKSQYSNRSGVGKRESKSLRSSYLSFLSHFLFGLLPKYNSSLLFRYVFPKWRHSFWHTFERRNPLPKPWRHKNVSEKTRQTEKRARCDKKSETF